MRGRGKGNSHLGTGWSPEPGSIGLERLGRAAARAQHRRVIRRRRIVALCGLAALIAGIVLGVRAFSPSPGHHVAGTNLTIGRSQVPSSTMPRPATTTTVPPPSGPAAVPPLIAPALPGEGKWT